MSTGAQLGTGTPWLSATDSPAPGSRRFRPGMPEEVSFPVAPMLDMAFQLLAFFILTFKARPPRPTSTFTCLRRRSLCPRRPAARLIQRLRESSTPTWKMTSWSARRPMIWAT